MSRSSAKSRDVVPLFAALGDETRHRLFVRLASSGAASITTLSARSSVTRQAISKHLAVLEEAGLVRSHRRGRERIWELEPARLADARAHLDTIARRWDEALERLRVFVER